MVCIIMTTFINVMLMTSTKKNTALAMDVSGSVKHKNTRRFKERAWRL
jgi:hypothetical protein